MELVIGRSPATFILAEGSRQVEGRVRRTIGMLAVFVEIPRWGSSSPEKNVDWRGTCGLRRTGVPSPYEYWALM